MLCVGARWEVFVVDVVSTRRGVSVDGEHVFVRSCEQRYRGLFFLKVRQHSVMLGDT